MSWRMIKGQRMSLFEAEQPGLSKQIWRRWTGRQAINLALQSAYSAIRLWSALLRQARRTSLLAAGPPGHNRRSWWPWAADPLNSGPQSALVETRLSSELT